MNSRLQQLRESLATQSPGAALFDASDLHRKLTLSPQLTANDPQLNDLLGGGIYFGDLMEWGMPPGKGGRELIMMFLARAARVRSALPLWSLWVSNTTDAAIYPPAWMARGVDLSLVRFARCQQVIEELKPLFLDPFFKLIVIDNPQRLSVADCAFLASKARQHGQIIMIVRNYFLSAKRGNVWARMRLNGWHDRLAGRFFIQAIKGIKPALYTFEERRGLERSP